MLIHLTPFSLLIFNWVPPLRIITRGTSHWPKRDVCLHRVFPFSLLPPAPKVETCRVHTFSNSWHSTIISTWTNSICPGPSEIEIVSFHLMSIILFEMRGLVSIMKMWHTPVADQIQDWLKKILPKTLNLHISWTLTVSGSPTRVAHSNFSAYSPIINGPLLLGSWDAGTQPTTPLQQVRCNAGMQDPSGGGLKCGSP